MKKKINVALLVDKSNNWIEYFISFKKILKGVKKKYKIKIFNDPKNIKNLDIVFILNYTKILTKNFLNQNGLNLVIHESDLPKGRGFAPIQWQILKNKKSIKVCLIEALSKFDSGKIFLKDTLKFDGTELYEEIRVKQADVIFKLINKFLKKYPNFKKKKQLGKPTYYRFRNKSDSKLDINFSIKKQFNLFRIVNNNQWPAYFIFKNKKYFLKIYKDK